jgi:hypothetical protein
LMNTQGKTTVLFSISNNAVASYRIK